MAVDDEDLTGTADPSGRLIRVGRSPAADESLARAFAVCFTGPAGRRVIDHLRRITIERRLGPEAPDALLRYVEGQRQLVDIMTTLIRRGGGAVPACADASGDAACAPEKEHCRD